MIKNTITGLCILIVLSGSVSAQKQTSFNVRDFGAVGNGGIEDTEAIQAAIDAAYKAAGGVVLLPPGVYLSRTLVLKDSVSLCLDGATLLGSTELTEFKPEFGSFRDSGGRRFGTSLIFARDAKRIGIRGTGVINGRGFPEFYPNDGSVARPSIIRLINCRDVHIEGITLLNSAAWVQHYVGCEDLKILNTKVRSYANKNNDGLDIESCERVLISGCNIDSEDDTIVLKALTRKPCRDIVISDCILGGLKSAVKIGTETAGNFENISISNCVCYGTRGLTLYTVDGGNIKGVTASNITMRGSYGVICLRLGDRMRPYALPEDERPSGPGKLSHIMISHIQAVGVTESNCFLSGIPGHRIENVILDNIQIEYRGGGLRSDSERKIPEFGGEYPKPRMFGTLPAYGLYVRHAVNLKLHNIACTVDMPDQRTALLLDDVSGVEISGFNAVSSDNGAPFIRFVQVTDGVIRNSGPEGPAETFLRVEGNSRGITVMENDFNLVRNPVSRGGDVPKKAVLIRNNYSH